MPEDELIKLHCALHIYVHMITNVNSSKPSDAYMRQ